MKKINKFLPIAALVLTLIMSTVLFACNGDEEKIWKVTFNYNYTGAPAAKVVDVVDKETVAEPTAPTRADYDFKGWFTNSACTTAFVFTTAITVDTTLYAKWELTPAVQTTWKVTFNYNYQGAPAATLVDVDDGESVSRPTAPTRADYDFKGWYTDSACTTAFVFTTAITADTTLYAKWDPKVVFTPDPQIATLNYESQVLALEGTWKISKVYAGGEVKDAVANAITFVVTKTLDPYELVESDTYIHNQVYNFSVVMTFGIPAINTALSADDIDRYKGDSMWDDFSMGKVVEEGGFYKQPGPAIMRFNNNDIRDYGLFLNLVAGVSADINTKNKEVVMGMNSDGQLLLGYSNQAIEFPGVQANWSYCLIFNKV